MKRNLFLVFVFSMVLFSSASGLPRNEYTLNGTNLLILGDSGGTVQIDINIQVVYPMIYWFVIPLNVTGTSNPILDTVLTGGRGDISPPGFAPPSLVHPFTVRMVDPYGPPLIFLAWDSYGLPYPDSGLFCRMFYQVTGAGTIVIDTMTDPETGSRLKMEDPAGPVEVYWSGTYTFNVRAIQRGDANCDGLRNISDIVYLICYLFKGGTPPRLLEAGDFNCDGKTTVTDVLYLLNYLFKGGPPPPC